MPYAIRKSGPKFKIVRLSDGKVVGTSTSRAKAVAAVRARYAGEKRRKQD